MDAEYEEFFGEIKEQLEQIKDIVVKYGFQQEFAMAYIGGLYTVQEDGSHKFAAQVDYLIADEDELDEMLSASLDLYRLSDEGMTADQNASVPASLDDTQDWDSDDWMRFINKNTKGDV